MLKTFFTTACKAMLLRLVHAEEESILDQATVTSSCNQCSDEQMVIGPGFKSKWYDNTNGNGDHSKEIMI